MTPIKGFARLHNTSCSSLSGYSELVAEVEENKKFMGLEAAVKMAIKTCMSRDILVYFLEKYAPIEIKLGLPSVPVHGEYLVRAYIMAMLAMASHGAGLFARGLMSGHIVFYRVYVSAHTPYPIPQTPYP